MNSTKKTARVAGFLYLLMAIIGAFGVLYVPAKLFVRGNAGATASNILAHEMICRIGMVAELVSAVLFIVLVWVLYHLFSGVDKTLASLMVALALISVTIAFVIVLNEIAALSLLSRNDFLSPFDTPQREALAMLFLGVHEHGFVINGIFWGLWLFPFGLLVMRSGFLPRILGVLLIIACFAYVASSLTSLLFPAYADVLNRFALPLEAAGELSIMFWLLIKGAKDRALHTDSPTR